MKHFSDGTYGTAAVAEPTLFNQQYAPAAERFLRFHVENPHVYIEFEKRALQLINAGRRHFGAKAIFEAMRFEWAATTTDEEFRLNNNYTAFYARIFENKHPEYAGFFEMRTQKE